MNVSLTSTFIPSLQIHFQTMENLFIVPCTTSFLHGNFKFPIYCKVQGLVEMRFVWKDPTSKILFSFNIFSTSFVTHSLRTSIITNANCTSYACSFSKYRRISYDVFALIFMRIGLIFQRQKMGVVKKSKKEKQLVTFLCNLNKLPLL